MAASSSTTTSNSGYSCSNSCHHGFSFLNPCIPKSQSDLPIQLTDHTRSVPNPQLIIRPNCTSSASSPISLLPDDLLITCLARVPSSSLLSLSATCRRFALLLSSPHFFLLRRRLSLISSSLLSISLSSTRLTLSFHSSAATWHLHFHRIEHTSASFISIRNKLFLLSSRSAFEIDTWTARISPISHPQIRRKKFAIAALNGQIYLAGGNSRSSAVEIYDPDSNTWHIATESPSRRYGCFGAASDEFFYVAGGVRVGNDIADPRAAHLTVGTVDMYHVGSKSWIARGSLSVVPGGGCIVGACCVENSLYVIARDVCGRCKMYRWEWLEMGESKKKRRWVGEWVEMVEPPIEACSGFGVRFRCCEMEGGRMACMVHVRRIGSNRGDAILDWRWMDLESKVLIYDARSSCWSLGLHFSDDFKRCGLVCVERLKK